jgi:iron complex transport system permease protein
MALPHSTTIRTRIRNPYKQFSRLNGGLFSLLVVIFFASLLVGRYPETGFVSPDRLLSDPLAQQLLWNLRLPRILSAVLIGMSLSAAGLVFQTVFANPLVEPGLLGVSQGAAFGAALSILAFGGIAWRVQSCAILFGLLGLGLSYLLARHIRFGGWVLRLLLAGIATSALFSSGVGLLKYLADPLSQLPEITFWLLGGLWSITWQQFYSILPLILLGNLVLLLMRWRLNLLSLEDDVAYSLGVSVVRERLLVLLAAVIITAAAISISGLIGWVGLIVPHLARRLVGAETRYSIPVSLMIGAGFTLICDDLARTLLAGELPLGVVTSLVGSITFLLLMTRPLSFSRK